MNTQVYRPKVFGGAFLTNAQKLNPGVTVVPNIDNDDRDDKFDRDDDIISGGKENDLAEWLIEVSHKDASIVNISRIGNINSVKIWLTPDKEVGTQLI